MQYIKRGFRKPITEGEYKGLYAERVTIAADTVNDLTTATKKTKFLPYSIAWIINSGDIYALNSSDEWILQEHINITL
jgi:hypothetical protein